VTAVACVVTEPAKVPERGEGLGGSGVRGETGAVVGVEDGDGTSRCHWRGEGGGCHWRGEGCDCHWRGSGCVGGSLLRRRVPPVRGSPDC
jgi:hypothetical protein